jgi:hypothetical protein
MRLWKTISLLAFLTILSLGYVYQQVESVKLSYSIESKEKKLKEILDRKETLVYTINNLESPGRLEEALYTHKIEIAYPKKGSIVRLAKLPSRTRAAGREEIGTEKIMSVLGFLDFFTSRAEAHPRER